MKFLTPITTIVSSIGGLLYGYDIGIISGVFSTPTFPVFFGMDGDASEAKQIQGDIVSLLQAGACIGALTANFYADRFGRRKSIIVSTLIFMFGSAIQTGSKNLPMILFGRFAGGWGVGSCSMLVPMYIAEISPLNIRGRMGALWQLNISVGMMLAFWVNYGCLVGLKTGDIQWRLPLGLQIVPGLILCIGMLFLPESIRWLALQDKFDDALDVLCRLRNLPQDHPNITNEFDQITNAVTMEKQQDGSKWKELMEPHNIRRLALGCFMQIAQQWTGTNAINYYGPLIFQTIGLNSSMSVLMTGVYGCVKVFFVLASFFFLDKKAVGRRPTLLLGSLANIIIFFVLGGMLYSIEKAIANGSPAPAAQGYVAMVMIYLFAVSFEWSWGPLTWIVCSEIFPNRIRAVCISITTSMNWAMNAIIGKITPLMIADISYGTFFFYGACCLTMGIIVYVFLPETKGRTLEEMDEIFLHGKAIVIGLGYTENKSILPTDSMTIDEKNIHTNKEKD
ncbi:general substrate transporter [Parasitella parasitica]|nr:general substrate transporter [Parasitella parasitica]